MKIQVISLADSIAVLKARFNHHQTKIGWDIYLFYSAGRTWKKIQLQPIAWVHQFGDSWLEHYRNGDNLEKELHRIAEELLPA